MEKEKRTCAEEPKSIVNIFLLIILFVFSFFSNRLNTLHAVKLKNSCCKSLLEGNYSWIAGSSPIRIIIVMII